MSPNYNIQLKSSAFLYNKSKYLLVSNVKKLVWGNLISLFRVEMS